MRTNRRRRRFRASARKSLLLVTAGSVAGVVAAAPVSLAATGGGVHRGELVSATQVRTLGDRDVTDELTADGISTSSVRYGVITYRLVYRTVDAFGRPTTASGLLALPVNDRHRLTTVSFTHGTELYRGDAPSVTPSGFEPGPVYTYASAGFASVAPDYLGLGTGPGPHPWMDVSSEGTASLDMLRAARTYVGRQGRTLQRQVMVTGFSQGASAALELGRELRSGADGWFRLGALASISGAYDFEHTELPAVLDGELVRLNPSPELGAKYSVVYAANTLVSLNRIHPFYSSPAEVFKRPYADTIEGLFDGDHTGQEVVNGTPATLDDLLTDRGRALLRHPTGGLATELRTIDGVCTGWTPGVPTRLYFADGDEQAVVANTARCKAEFGAKATVVDLGTPDYQGSRHLGSNLAAAGQIVDWFQRLAG